MSTAYISRPTNIIYSPRPHSFESIEPAQVLEAISVTHQSLDDLPQAVFRALKMRGLSGFLGEMFADAFTGLSKNRYVLNPHQDGYPDMLLADAHGRTLLEEIKANGWMRAKAPFSPFPGGGIEIKATCGAVPDAKSCSKKGFEKPDLGDQRIAMMKSYDWKSHHRMTTNLMGLLWDFIEGKPRIVAVFFSPTLTEDSWGRIVQPKDGGGNTTSVSIMSRAGVRNMYDNWLVVIDDDRYKNFIDGYNKSDLLKTT